MTYFTQTFLTQTLLAVALASPTAQDCSLKVGTPSAQRVFTNKDLERMAACRHQAGAQSEARPQAPDPSERGRGRTAKATASGRDRSADAENDWRAQWRSIDQKARKLRREALELRKEAQESPRDPKKRVIGRRSPSMLITRAERLEAEARELEEEFQERARREGALPGWIRPRSR